MSFMSGTLENLLLYSGSQQSQGGKPLYSNAVGSQSIQSVYTSSQSTETVHVFGQSNSNKESLFTDIQSDAPDNTLTQSDSKREQVYSELKVGHSRQVGSKNKSRPQLNRGVSLGKQLQRGVNQESYENLKLSKRRRTEAWCTSSERVEPLCDTDYDVWESMPSMVTNSDDTDWRIMQRNSRGGNGSKTKTLDRSAAQGSSSTGYSLGQSLESSTSTNVMAVLGTKCSGTESFTTTEDTITSNKAQLAEKSGSQSRLSPIRKGPSTLAGISRPHILDTVNISGEESNKMLNNQCFQAAISEGFGSPSQTLSYKARPVKRFSYHVHHNRLPGVCSKHTEVPKHLTQWDQTHLSVSQAHYQQQDILSMSLAQLDMMSESSGQPYSQDNLTMDTSSSSSEGSKQDLFAKKYRYNHTALALQQSGLMKTTIKTAEILRRGKILQAELNKLRKETALFMKSVLSNPENKNFREIYMKLNHNKFVS